jgi:hypothetical protein
MLPWKRLVTLPDAELVRVDPVEQGIACAAGLPGVDAPEAVLTACCKRLDDATERVRWETAKAIDRFHRHPEHFQHHEGYFRMLALVEVLQLRCGLHYDPAKIPEDAPFDVADSFPHGALLGGGTCANIPVVIVAVGRRLGYPLRLVAAKGGRYNHLLARWQDPDGHFNVEATAEGLRCPPDDYYRQGRYWLTAEEERRGGFLRSMTPKEELASLLVQRHHCWKGAGVHRLAVEAVAWASALSPENDFLRHTLYGAMNDWLHALRAWLPPRFPRVLVDGGVRRFPSSVPVEVESEILGMEAAENLLRDGENEARWWAPLRRGAIPRHLPAVALARFDPDGGCCVRMKYAGEIGTIL